MRLYFIVDTPTICTGQLNLVAAIMVVYCRTTPYNNSIHPSIKIFGKKSLVNHWAPRNNKQIWFVSDSWYYYREVLLHPIWLGSDPGGPQNFIFLAWRIPVYLWPIMIISITVAPLLLSQSTFNGWLNPQEIIFPSWDVNSLFSLCLPSSIHDRSTLIKIECGV